MESVFPVAPPSPGEVLHHRRHARGPQSVREGETVALRDRLLWAERAGSVRVGVAGTRPTVQIEYRRQIHGHAGRLHPAAHGQAELLDLRRRHGGRHRPGRRQVADQVGHALDGPALLVGHDERRDAAGGGAGQLGQLGSEVSRGLGAEEDHPTGASLNLGRDRCHAAFVHRDHHGLLGQASGGPAGEHGLVGTGGGRTDRRR
jgi:hypothetical protein